MKDNESKMNLEKKQKGNAFKGRNTYSKRASNLLRRFMGRPNLVSNLTKVTAGTLVDRFNPDEMTELRKSNKTYNKPLGVYP